MTRHPPRLRPTPSQIQALEDIERHGNPWYRVRGQSQHGGWQSVVGVIQRAGWACSSPSWALTETGREVLKRFGRKA